MKIKIDRHQKICQDMSTAHAGGAQIASKITTQGMGDFATQKTDSELKEYIVLEDVEAIFMRSTDGVKLPISLIFKYDDIKQFVFRSPLDLTSTILDTDCLMARVKAKKSGDEQTYITPIFLNGRIRKKGAAMSLATNNYDITNIYSWMNADCLSTVGGPLIDNVIEFIYPEIDTTASSIDYDQDLKLDIYLPVSNINNESILAMQGLAGVLAQTNYD